jgi:hypothetical protein
MTFLHDCSSWSLRRISSNLTTADTTRHTTHVALSTLVGKMHEKGLRDFRSRLATRPTSLEIGVPIGFMLRWTCQGFLAMKDRLILFPRPLMQWLLPALLHTIIEWLESGIVKVHSTWPVQFLVDATLSRSSLLLKFGRFRVDGPLPKSWIST